MAHYQNILVGVDFREVGEPEIELLTTDSDEAVARALILAQAEQAKVTFAHVFAVPPEALDKLESSEEDTASIRAAATAALDELVARAGRRGIEAEHVFLYGKPWEALPGFMKTRSFDLLVMGTRQQRGFRRALFGSTANRAMLACPSPVLIAHHQPLRSYERIVIATDLSDTGREAVRHGLIFAAINEGRAEIVHAVENWFEGRWYRAGLARDAIEREHEEDKQEAEKKLRAEVDAVRGQLGEVELQEPVLRVATGQPEEVIWRAVTGERTDLVVMGLVGRSGFQRFWIGNTAERLLPEIPCSLLAVKPPDFVPH